MQKERVKFQTNLPELITFQFDDFRSGEGDYGIWYAYGVENRGKDKMLFPTEILHNKLQAINNLKGRTLEITKVEGENNRKFWVIKENDAEIVSQQRYNAPQSPTRPLYEQSKLPLQEKLDRLQGQLNTTFDKVQNNQTKIVLKIEDLEQKIHALWASCVSGDVEKEKSYELHSIKIIKPEEIKESEQEELNIR